MFITIMMIIC